MNFPQPGPLYSRDLRKTQVPRKPNRSVWGVREVQFREGVGSLQTLEAVERRPDVQNTRQILREVALEHPIGAPRGRILTRPRMFGTRKPPELLPVGRKSILGLHG